MPLPKEHIYTSEDYWNLPEGQRAELIDGKLYAMAPSNRIHQRLVHQLDKLIGNYIDSNLGACGQIVQSNYSNIVFLVYGNIG